MSALKSLIEKVLKLDKKATAGPWFAVKKNRLGQYYAVTQYPLKYFGEGYFEKKADAELTAHYRQAAVKLALAAQRMEKALEFYSSLEVESFPLKLDCSALRVTAKTALADVQKLLEEK